VVQKLFLKVYLSQKWKSKSDCHKPMKRKGKEAKIEDQYPPLPKS
jgi:hypothetical protein